RRSELSLLRALVQHENYSPEETREVLTLVRDHLPMFSWIGLTDADGLVLASSRGHLEGVSIAGRPMYYEALDGGFMGDVLPVPDRTTLRFVEISLPLIDDDGSLNGVLASQINWQWIREVRVDFLLAQPDERRDLSVIGLQGGLYILGSPDRVGQPASPELIQAARDTDGYIVGSGSEANIYGFAASQGHRDFPGFGWITVVSEPVSDTFFGLQRQQRSILFAGLVIALIASVIGYISSRTLTKSLRHLHGQSEALRLGGREMYSRLSRIREFDSLGESLDYLARELSRSETAAHRDSLTGLQNRLGSADWFEQAISTCRRYEWTLIVMAIDLDGFKAINDAHGHAAGDAILTSTARRLDGTVRPDELTARWGGDEFVVCVYVRERDGQRVGETVADRILASIREATVFEGHELTVGCSIGLTTYDPSDGSSWTAAHERADKALYTAKNHGKNQWAWEWA
ncbi:MAG: sensor domain-containing diguanylate cyclase, partial [Spirochaetaceae bacterium]